VEIDAMSMADFMGGLNKIKPSVDQNQLKKYEDWTKAFGQDG
jgi:SpoVK/Ycf46/Vps4 family AAA+-type ATPase